MGEEIRRNIQSSICFIYTFFHLYVVWQPNCRVIHLVYCVGGHTALHRENKGPCGRDQQNLICKSEKASRSSRLDFQPNAAIETRGCNVSQEPLYLEQNWVDLLGQNNQNITYKTEVVLTIPI